MLLARCPASEEKKVAVRPFRAATVLDVGWERRVGALHAWGNLSPTLIGTNEGSYRQLMGKRATVILSGGAVGGWVERWCRADAADIG